MLVSVREESGDAHETKRIFTACKVEGQSGAKAADHTRRPASRKNLAYEGIWPNLL